MSSAAIMVQHGLVGFLVLVAPLWDRYEIPRLKSSTNPRKKIRFYTKIVAASWVCAIVAVLTVGFATLVRIHKAPAEITWLGRGTRSGIFLEGLTAGILIALILPAVFALGSGKIRTRAGRAARKLAFLLPSTPVGRHHAVTARVRAASCRLVACGFLPLSGS
jgi:hypothetical protein